MNGSEIGVYSFSDAEIKNLALLFRNHEAVIDESLDFFRCFLENHIYCIMTIEEAEIFFYEKTDTKK